MGLANLGSESETCVGSLVHLVEVPITFEKNFYRLPFTPPSLVRRTDPSRETKVTDTELNWLCSALIAKPPIDPSYLMINRWCCDATSGAGDIGLGCYLSMLAISLRPGITRNPEHLLRGNSLGIEYL
jgi:hypothetical protein